MEAAPARFEEFTNDCAEQQSGMASAPAQPGYLRSP